MGHIPSWGLKNKSSLPIHYRDILAQGFGGDLGLVVRIGLGGHAFGFHRIKRFDQEVEGYFLSRKHILDIEDDLAAGDIIALDIALPAHTIDRILFGGKSGRHGHIHDHHSGFHRLGRIKGYVHRDLDFIIDRHLVSVIIDVDLEDILFLSGRIGQIVPLHDLADGLSFPFELIFTLSLPGSPKRL